MKAAIITALGMVAALFFTSGVASGSPLVITTVTSTIIGSLVPDSAHFANTLVSVTFPLFGMVGAVMIPMMFHTKGDFVVYFALTGNFLGCVFADMGVNTTNLNPQVTFAQIFVSGLLLFLWWWNS